MDLASFRFLIMFFTRNPSRTMTWQFDALDKDFNLIRQCEAFGEPRLVPWSWFRATFTRSFFKIIATILNTFLYFENRKKTKRMEKK